MKAFEMLKHYKKVTAYIPHGMPTKCIDEAILELEALQQPKNCEGCKYEDGEIYKTLIENGHDIHICALCTRATNDYFKAKE